MAQMFGGSTRAVFSCQNGWSTTTQETYYVCSTETELDGDAHAEIWNRAGARMQREHDRHCNCNGRIDLSITIH